VDLSSNPLQSKLFGDLTTEKPINPAHRSLKSKNTMDALTECSLKLNELASLVPQHSKDPSVPFISSCGAIEKGKRTILGSNMSAISAECSSDEDDLFESIKPEAIEVRAQRR